MKMPRKRQRLIVENWLCGRIDWYLAHASEAAYCGPRKILHKSRDQKLKSSKMISFPGSHSINCFFIGTPVQR